VDAKHAEWEVPAGLERIRIYAHAGKVGMQVGGGTSMSVDEARQLGAALTSAAELSAAQADIRRAADEHGSRSPEAERARARLEELNERYFGA
jgi:hypothetical protein